MMKTSPVVRTFRTLKPISNATRKTAQIRRLSPRKIRLHNDNAADSRTTGIRCIGKRYYRIRRSAVADLQEQEDILPAISVQQQH